ncbi:MAG: hypothetical protein OEU76_06495 [Cyclobacteriaceae bacterium]|nr:hypothetical protein [Cyclobacteriaceae bacterium]
MESHKKILGILYIVSGILQMITLVIVSLFLTSFLPFIASEVEPDATWVMELVGTLVPGIIWGIIILFSIPSVIGGVSLLQGKSWALTLLLVMGCFKLFSFPIGTALGVYTIWVYAESNKKSAAS